jgi:hypothetical protein
MVGITDNRTTVPYIWLTTVITHRFFSVYFCVYITCVRTGVCACACAYVILMVITIKRGSLLDSSEVKMKSYI